MEKRKDAQIYLLAHKMPDYGLRNDSLYTPIECGAALHDEAVCEVRDNESEGNLSAWNGLFAELSGIWHVWNTLKIGGNSDLKFIGFCQYRRRLDFAEDTDFAEIFDKVQIVCAHPLNVISLVEDHYKACHCYEDLKACEEVVKELYPDYAEDWDYTFRNSILLFYSNGWIMKREDFEAYCEWLFSILDELKKRLGFNSMEDVRAHVEKNIAEKKCNKARGVEYQMQIFGFLSERLFTLWVMSHYDTVLAMPYHKMENGI